MKTMKKFLHSPDGASRGAALIIVLALVAIASALGFAYFSRTTTDRQLAKSSYNDTSADLLARSALDIMVSGLKQEIATSPAINANNIQPFRYGVPPITDPMPIPNLIRRSVSGDPTGLTSSVRSDLPSANGRIISLARWNSHYLIPRASSGTTIDSTPVSSFTAPYWVLVTPQGPVPTPAPSAVIGRYAFAVYDEGGLINMNLGGYPNYANLTRPTRPTRKLRPTYPEEESEIMLAACQTPGFTPVNTNITLSTGVPCSILLNTNHNPTSFGVNFLPDGLSINTTNGNITGIPTSPGQWTVTPSATNNCGTGYGILHLTIQGFPFQSPTPWPINVARKGTVAFANLTTLPATPTVITPTTPASSMGGFLDFTSINKLMGWRNYATTQQTGASFNNPSFLLASADNYAQYFLGAIPPFTTPFTLVSTGVVNNRTDQAVMTRQELIRLQRTIGFSQSLLQYLGTFSRELNRPAASWLQLRGSVSGARWDMNNLALMIPVPWYYPGNHGQGHAYGNQRNDDLVGLFGLEWVAGHFGTQGDRFTDPNYYGHWTYKHQLNPLPADEDPDFFQIIDYAMNQAIGVNDPNHVRNTFTVGAALIDQYDTDDMHDSGAGGSPTGNTITIIDPYDTGIYTNYVYGIERMSFDDPLQNEDRPPFAPYPPPVVQANYPLLNRRFENVGEFGYAYSPDPLSQTPTSKTLNFASSTSNARALLDFFTYNAASNRAGIVNLNTRNGPVLASIIRGALLHDLGSENPPTDLVSRDAALNAAQAIVQETTNTGSGHGPALTRADVARLVAVAAPQLPVVPGVPVDEVKQTIARALAEAGQARTWNVMIDVIAQTGNYAPGTPDLTDPTKFIVQGEKRYWLHIALDRDDATVLGAQLEEVVE